MPSLPPHDEGLKPPEDADDWSDDQWLAWLAATDDWADDAEAAPRLSRWRDRRSSLVLGTAMLGMRDAIYGPPEDQVVAVADASGDPPGDDEPEVHLDPDHPERSEVVHRPSSRRRRRG